MSLSYTVRPFSPEDQQRVERAFGTKDALVEFNPGKCVLPPFHARIAQQLIDMPVREDDVWLISFARTGSTWCQEMVWLLGNDLDFDGARDIPQHMRAPLVEASTVLFQYEATLDKELLENSVDFVGHLPSPRYIKTHLPLPLLPAELNKIKPKIIYTCRNPKDMCVSYYHHSKMAHNLQIDFEEFCDQLIRGTLPLGPVFEHYLLFWNKRRETNILFLKYEDMKRDLRGTLKKIAAFLGKSYTEEQYDKACDFLSFQKMRENKACNWSAIVEGVHGENYYDKIGIHFMRKGQIGDWRNHMSEEMAKRFDDWIEANTRGTGLTFH